jgi:hypothetical protein
MAKQSGAERLERRGSRSASESGAGFAVGGLGGRISLCVGSPRSGGEQVSRGSAYFMDKGTAWGTRGQLVGGMV